MRKAPENGPKGHAAGDGVLVGVAQLLASNLRDGDVLARWGGEEFLALLPASTVDAACATAERIRAAVEATPLRPAEGKEPALHITLSFGVTSVAGQEDLQAAITRADRALYASKHGGRNRVSKG